MLCTHRDRGLKNVGAVLEGWNIHGSSGSFMSAMVLPQCLFVQDRRSRSMPHGRCCSTIRRIRSGIREDQPSSGAGRGDEYEQIEGRPPSLESRPLLAANPRAKRDWWPRFSEKSEMSGTASVRCRLNLSFLPVLPCTHQTEIGDQNRISGASLGANRNKGNCRCEIPAPTLLPPSATTSPTPPRNRRQKSMDGAQKNESRKM